MKKDIKHLSLRLAPDLLKKFDYVARYDDRSMNWLMTKLICGCVAEFEEQHGKIEFDEENDKVGEKY